MNNIKEQIILRMAEREISQSKIAEDCLITRPTISKILRGEDWTKSKLIVVLEYLELNDLISLLK